MTSQNERPPARSRAQVEQVAVDLLERQTGEAATTRASAPGRVNLLGGHTDYNEGFVLPMALPFATAVALRPRSDDRVRLWSDGFEGVQFGLGDEPAAVPGWGRYIAGMARFCAELGIDVAGFDAAIASSIPAGAGLSSSAALEVATGFALAAQAGHVPDPVLIAKLGQRVENEVIGVPTGIMDQLISATAQDGTASLIDCRDFSSRPVVLPSEVAVLILDTMTRHDLETSDYGDRRAACERVAALLGVQALRDVTLEELEAARDRLGADFVRARHVVTENERTLLAVEDLDKGDVAAFGHRLSDTHRSLRDDYEVSSPALDLMAEIVESVEGCLGARMTGGGFGGSVVAVVEADAADEIRAAAARDYEARTTVRPDVWIGLPSPGARATAQSG